MSALWLRLQPTQVLRCLFSLVHFCSVHFIFPGWEGTLAENVTWGLLRGGLGGALGPVLPVSDMSAMIATHQEEEGRRRRRGGEADEFR